MATSLQILNQIYQFWYQNDNVFYVKTSMGTKYKNVSIYQGQQRSKEKSMPQRSEPVFFHHIIFTLI